MTHSFSGLIVRTTTINSGDVPPLNMFEHVPSSPVNQTLSKYDVIWKPIVTIYSDDF